MVGDIGQTSHLYYYMFLCLYACQYTYHRICSMLHDCCECSMCYHYIISVCLWYDIIDITRLLRMIYVLWLVLDGNSSREGFAAI